TSHPPRMRSAPKARLGALHGNDEA
ncbi:MAG: hypothetical protein PWK00_00380, partial [Coxiella burnetii]|nr:hypothetical protein [Coxiella burnetii]